MSGSRKILIVDDEGELREALAEQLALYDEFEIVQAETAARAVQVGKSDRGSCRNPNHGR